MRNLHPVKAKDKTPVVYAEWRWRLLESLRERGLQLLQALESLEQQPLIIGSVARGDVSPSSDVDVYLLGYIPSWRVALCLENAGFEVKVYKIVQATPQTALRFIAVLDEKVEVSVPISKLKRTEEEFPRYAGAVSTREILEKIRVRGVNKRLLFIEPTSYGHDEWSVMGRENEVAELLGVSLQTVLEREAMRSKRAREGKTGFYFYAEVPGEESPEDFICQAARRNPSIRETVAETLNCY
ncbi:MAG: DNA polymerase subunit beta [Infirmifilum sp.]